MIRWRSELALLRRGNNDRLEHCTQEDASLIRKIRMQLSVPQISEFEQQIAVQGLLDMAEEARPRGDTLTYALGVTPEDFCRGIMENCRHTGWGDRALSTFLRLLASCAYFFIITPMVWLGQYDRLELSQAVTGKDYGLRGPETMLMPLSMLLLLAAFFLLIELWAQFIDSRISLRRGGRAISVSFYVFVWAVFLILMQRLPEGGTLVPIDLRFAVPLYVIVLTVVSILYRVRIHYHSLEYAWRR